jgi:hypothetical protein
MYAMKKTALAVALASIALVGCGDGGAKPEASATSETGVSTTNNAEVSQQRELAKSREQTVTQQVELSTLIVEAVQSLRPRNIQDGKTNVGLDHLVCGQGLDISTREHILPGIKQQFDLESMTPDHPIYALAKGTQEEANAACVAGMWKEAVSPLNAWPRTSNAHPLSAQGKADMRAWGAEQLGLVLGVSSTMAEVAAELAKLPGSTVPELEEKARQILIANAARFRKAIEDKRDEVKAHADRVNLNLTGQGPAPINFTLDQLDYQHGPAGALVTSAGTPSFGGGYLLRVKYEVAAVAGSSATMTKSSGGSITEEVSSGTTASQGASIR